MKFPYSVLYYLICDDLNYENPEDLPFEVADIEDYDTISDSFDQYIKEHNIEVVETEVLDYDLEFGTERIYIVFRYDDTFYGFTYKYADYDGYEFPENEELTELEPAEKTVTYYKPKQ